MALLASFSSLDGRGRKPTCFCCSVEPSLLLLRTRLRLERGEIGGELAGDDVGDALRMLCDWATVGIVGNSRGVKVGAIGDNPEEADDEPEVGGPAA